MCDCIKKINEKLEKNNFQVERALSMDENLNKIFCVTPIHTEFIDPELKKRGQRTPILTGNYCPFCGVKIERE